MKWVLLGLALLWTSGAQAQPKQVVATCGGVTVAQTGDTINGTANPVGQECVNATVSASVAGFSPASTGTPIAATTGGVTGTLPAGTVVVASNVGSTNGAYCKLGASATTSDQPIPPNSWFAFTVGAATQLTCITASSTTTVNMVGGSGLPTGSGGGGGGSGGGAVTIADGADVTLGAKADAKSTATDTTPITIMSVLKQVSASVQAAASSLAGTLTVATHAVTQSGVWNITNVSGTVSLPTGAGTSANQTSQITQETATAAALGATADAPCTVPTTSTACTNIALLKAINNLLNSAAPAGTNLVGNVGVLYPAGSTPITASATGTTAATTATLTGAAAKSTYLCGLSIRANATAAATADSTVTGTVTGTLHFTQWTAPLASGIGLTEQIFSPCIVASATNTGIAVISAAPGAGGVVSVTAWGYQL